KAKALLVDPRRGYAHELQVHLEDVARKTHPAQRGEKQLGLLLTRTPRDAPIGEPQLERLHMTTDGAFDVVVFPVHIGRHHAAQGDELGAWRYGREKAARQVQAKQLRKRKTGLC